MDRRTFVLLGASAVLAAATSPSLGATSVRLARNVVLVHGAYVGGACWTAVVERLRRQGVTATVVEFDPVSLTAAVAATRKVLNAQDGPTVLVGHCWGGAVISQAGLHSNVTALVFVAAVAPDVGESPGALAEAFPTPPSATATVTLNGMSRLDEATFLTDVAGDLALDQARALYAAHRAVPGSLHKTKNTAAAWKTKPSWYAVSSEDRVLAPELQHFLAMRIGAPTIELDAGHLSPLTHPREIADLVVTATQAGDELLTGRDPEDEAPGDGSPTALPGADVEPSSAAGLHD